MTPEVWDINWHRIREDYRNVGFDELADVDTVTEFGPRPTEET